MHASRRQSWSGFRTRLSTGRTSCCIMQRWQVTTNWRRMPVSRAGERSLQIFAHEEAYRLAERGLKHLDGLPDGEQKVRFHVKLLVIKVHAAYKHGEEVPELVSRLQEAADTAMALGLHNEAVSALHARSWLQQWSNDTSGRKPECAPGGGG